MSNPVGWETPKENWIPVDGIANTDLNRAEANVRRLRDWVCQQGAVDVVGEGFALVEPTGTVYWEKHAQGIVVAHWPQLRGGLGGTFKIAPATTWPEDIRVNSAGIYVAVPVVDGQYFVYSPSIGAIELPYDANTSINLVHHFNGSQGQFTDDSGLVECMITYYTTLYTTTTTMAP